MSNDKWPDWVYFVALLGVLFGLPAFVALLCWNIPA